jgi:hypothetical protein
MTLAQMQSQQDAFGYAVIWCGERCDPGEKVTDPLENGDGDLLEHAGLVVLQETTRSEFERLVRHVGDEPRTHREGRKYYRVRAE